MYELFEHTADLGLRARAADLDALFVEAARALFAAVITDPTSVRPAQRVDVTLQGDDKAYLLFDWLKALLYHVDAGHLIFSRFEVKVTDDGLTGAAWGEAFDPGRHSYEHEVKAITYHGLRVECVGEEWEAEVIVDI